MNQLKEATKQLQELIEFAETKGWSEEELAKVINLLHFHLEQSSNPFSLTQYENL